MDELAEDKVPDAAVTRRSVMRRAVSAAAVVGMGSPGAAACGSSSGSGGSTTAPSADTGTAAAAGAAPAGTKPTGTLRLLYMGSAAESATYKAMFARFQAKYPAMKLETIADPSTTWAGFFTNVQVKVAGGQNFDLIYLPTEGQRLFASKGLIQPIDAWITRDKAEVDEFLADADPSLVKDARTLSSPDSSTYFLPYVFNTMCVWYRKSMLAKAGAKTPSAAWTWEDFRSVAEATSKPSSRTYGFYADPNDFSGIEPWLLTNGATVLSADWKTCTVNSPAAVESVSFTADLVKNGWSPKPGGTFDAVSAFAKGQIAMIGNGRWGITDARASKVVDDIAIVPWPVKKKQGSPVGWGSFGILKSSTNKDSAWAFVKFLLQRDTQDFIAETGFSGAVPARRSSGTGSHVLLNSPAGTPHLYEALAYSTPVPGTAKSNLIEQAIADSYSQILAGTLAPAAGIKQLAATVSGAL